MIRPRILLIGASLTLAACGGGDGGDLEAFCDGVDTAGVEGSFENYDPTDLEATEAQFAAAETAYRALRNDAPGDIADALDVLIAYTADFRAGLAATDAADPAGANATGLSLEGRFDEVAAATQELEQFVSKSCVP